MISVDSLLYKIDQRLNKLATNDHQEIALEDKLLVLNESQIQLILNFIDPNNIYKIGLDSFKKRYQDLQFLIENTEDHPLKLKVSDKNLNRYIAYTSELDPKYMFYIDGYLLADKDECKDHIIYTNADLIKHADITLLLKDSNFKPSFEYQETILDISSDELHVYSDGTFTPTKLYLSYLRYPKEISVDGIVNFDGTDSIRQDCELESYLEDTLLDIAIQKLAMYTENNQAAQAAAIRKQTNE